MRSKAVSLTMAALFVLIVPQAPAEEPLKLTNEKDRVNALGASAWSTVIMVTTP
jgi:hypothetical protein